MSSQFQNTTKVKLLSSGIKKAYLGHSKVSLYTEVSLFHTASDKAGVEAWE